MYAYDVSSEDDLIDLINRDLVDVGILIPENFDRDLLSGTQAKIPIYIDGSMQPTDSLTLQLKLNSITSMVAQDMLIEKVVKSGISSSLNLPVTGILKTLYNPNGDSKIYMIPGLIAILLQVQTLILSALAIVREREQGTMEQLIVTPVRSWELMLGKIIPYLVVCIFNLLALLWLSKLFFGVTVAGNLGVLDRIEHHLHPRFAGDGCADLNHFPIPDAGHVHLVVRGAHAGHHPLRVDVLTREYASFHLLVQRNAAGHPVS